MYNLNGELIKRISDYVEEGCPFSTSFLLAGVNPDAGTVWRMRGHREPDTVYGELTQQMDEAKARFIRSQVDNIRAAAPEDWKASARLLESRDRSNWLRGGYDPESPQKLEGETAEQQLIALADKVSQGKIDANSAQIVGKLLTASVEVGEITRIKSQLDQVLETVNALTCDNAENAQRDTDKAHTDLQGSDIA